MEWISDPQAWIALGTLTALEIVLGIDNIIFISILVGRLPEHQRQRGRIIGLAMAMGMPGAAAAAAPAAAPAACPPPRPASSSLTLTC